MRLGRWGYAAGYIVLSIAVIGSLWVIPYLPTNEGPEWVFATHVENHYLDPGTPYWAAFAPALQFASRGFAMFYGPLEAWLGWQRGLQVALSMVVCVVGWGFVALVRAIDPRRSALGFLGFPLALSWSLYMGLWSFVIATGFGLVVIGVAAQMRAPTWRGRAALAFLLLLVAVTHVFGAVLTGLAILCLFVVRAKTDDRLDELGRLALMGLPTACILVGAALVANQAGAPILTEPFAYLPWRHAAAALPQTLVPGPLPRALLVTTAIAVAACLAAVRARRDDTSTIDRGLGVAAILLLLVGTLAPLRVPGCWFFSQHFLPLGATLAFAIVPVERMRVGARRFVPAGLFVGALLWTIPTYAFHHRLAATCADAVLGLSARVHRSTEQLPLPLDWTEGAPHDLIHAEVPLMKPLLHMGALYATVEGGLTPLSFGAGTATYPFIPLPHHMAVPPAVLDLEHYWDVFRSDAFYSDASYRHATEDELASFGTSYEGVVLLAARPDDLALWHRRGYVADWEQGKTLIAHFEPCRISLTVPARAAAPPPLVDVRAGKRTLVRSGRPVPRPGADGLVRLELPKTPCGELSVRVRWVRPEGLVELCRNADAQGEVSATITRESDRVVCDLPDSAAPQ